MTIWSATSGDGVDRVVLVHGSLDRSAGLLKLSRRLDRHYSVVRYDRRGYGRSASHRGPFTIDDQVADLDLVAGGAGRTGGRLFLFGHSYGGNVALAFADRFPGRVAAVVVYEAPMSWEQWWPDRTVGDHTGRTGHPSDAAESFMRHQIGDERWERLPGATRRARRAEGATMVAELADLRSRRPWHPDRVESPVLFLHGEHGRDHHVRASELSCDLFADARLGVVAGARHFGPNTHPAVVAAMTHAHYQSVT